MMVLLVWRWRWLLLLLLSVDSATRCHSPSALYGFIVAKIVVIIVIVDSYKVYHVLRLVRRSGGFYLFKSGWQRYDINPMMLVIIIMIIIIIITDDYDFGDMSFFIVSFLLFGFYVS